MDLPSAFRIVQSSKAHSPRGEIHAREKWFNSKALTSFERSRARRAATTWLRTAGVSP